MTDEHMELLTDNCVRRAVELLAIDSPTGYTWLAAEHVTDTYRTMGLCPEITKKGGVLVCLNPEVPAEDSLLLEAHLDTLGGHGDRDFQHRPAVSDAFGRNGA